MDEQRKYAILFAATILAARKLNEIGVKPCPARECANADAISNADLISRELRNVGRAGQIERIVEGWDGRSRTATGAKRTKITLPH